MSYDVDDEIDSKLKYGISKGLSLHSVGYEGALHEEYAEFVNDNINIVDDEKSKIHELLESGRNISTLLQLDSPGFLQSERQHRQFSISVLHAAQKFNQAIENASNLQKVEFSWREMFKILSKYRQLADFKDIVFWIDKFPPVKKREDLYGLKTSIIEGPKKVLRYYTYYQRSFEVTKQLMLQNGYYDDNEILIPVKKKSEPQISFKLPLPLQRPTPATDVEVRS